jgi:hypothetical protein
MLNNPALIYYVRVNNTIDKSSETTLTGEQQMLTPSLMTA